MAKTDSARAPGRSSVSTSEPLPIDFHTDCSFSVHFPQFTALSPIPFFPSVPSEQDGDLVMLC